MQRKRETRPIRQDRERVQKSTTSLSQREWERKWDKEMGPAVVAMAIVMFTFLAFCESGVIPC